MGFSSGNTQCVNVLSANYSMYVLQTTRSIHLTYISAFALRYFPLGRGFLVDLKHISLSIYLHVGIVRPFFAEHSEVRAGMVPCGGGQL